MAQKHAQFQTLLFWALDFTLVRVNKQNKSQVKPNKILQNISNIYVAYKKMSEYTATFNGYKIRFFFWTRKYIEKEIEK